MSGRSEESDVISAEEWVEERIENLDGQNEDENNSEKHLFLELLDKYNILLAKSMKPVDKQKKKIAILNFAKDYERNTGKITTQQTITKKISNIKHRKN